jgi:hypothetical protein
MDPVGLAKRRLRGRKNSAAHRAGNRAAAPGALGKLQKLKPGQRASFRDNQTGGAYAKKEAEAFKRLAKLLTRRGLFYV